MNETLPPENDRPASAAPTDAAPVAMQPAEAEAAAGADPGADPSVGSAADSSAEPGALADTVVATGAQPELLTETLPEVLAEVRAEVSPAQDNLASTEAAAAPEAPAPADAPPAVADLSPAATAQRLAELFPALFGTEAKPIKLRIQADIQQRAPGIFSRKSLSLFLHRHTTSTPYLKALATMAARFDLDGQAAGEVAAEHKAAAEVEVARRKQLGAERRAAEREKALAARREAEQQARREQTKQQRTEQKARRQAWQQKQAEGLAADIAREQERAQGEAQTQAQRDRAALLRAYETSTLTRNNFLVLKRLTSQQLDEQLALARSEAAARGPRASAPTRPQPMPQQTPFNAGRKPPGSPSPA